MSFGPYIKFLAREFGNRRTPEEDLEQYGLLLELEGMTKNQIRSRLFEYAFTPGKCEVFGGARASKRYQSHSEEGLVSNTASPDLVLSYLDYCSDSIDELILQYLLMGCNDTDIQFETGYSLEFIQERISLFAQKIRRDLQC